MARIRSVKPDFFRHEVLQDLEAKNPGMYPMFVFEGLWTISDKQGVFPYRPRQIKLDILPFLNFDMEKTLQILVDAGQIQVFDYEGNKYGYIKTFEKHQRISGEEAKQDPRYPTPPQEAGRKQEGSSFEAGETGEVLPSCPGKGKGNGVGERERERERIGENETDDRSKLVIALWQGNADIFNAFSSLKRPKDWQSFWKKSAITREQIETAFKNYIQGVQSGAIERQFIPAHVDTFVLNGWILKSQDPYRKQSPPPSTGKSASGPKKSLGGLEA
jgi:hypothetical protein